MEMILNNLVKALGWTVLHSLWQGALIYALLFLLLQAWSTASARLRHNMAFGSLLLLFTCFIFTFASQFKGNINASSVPPEGFLLPIQREQNSGKSFLRTELYFPLVAIAYLTGIAIQLSVLSYSYIRLKRLQKTGTMPVPENWFALFIRTKRALSISKKTDFYLSTQVSVPLVVGYLKPVVLFPLALATQLDLKQVEAILIHELSHIRRNDYLINFLKTCLEIFLFFNPFAWLCSRYIQIEREHACDDMVVQLTGSPLSYAQALLKLEISREQHSPALTLAATGNNHYLYQRIKRITHMKTNYTNVKHQLMILGLAFTTVLSLAWIQPKKPVLPLENKKSGPLKSLKGSSLENRPLDAQLLMKADTDSVSKKKKSKMTITKNGRTVEYEKFEDLPDSLQQELTSMLEKIKNKNLQISRLKLDNFTFDNPLNSLELKVKLGESLKQQKLFPKDAFLFDYVKLKNGNDSLLKTFTKRKDLFQKEWTEQHREIFKKLKEKQEFQSKEQKNRLNEALQSHVTRLKELKLNENTGKWMEFPFKEDGVILRLESEKLKDQLKELREFRDSPEYKELRKKYESDLEKLKKEKGLQGKSLSPLIELLPSDLRPTFPL